VGVDTRKLADHLWRRHHILVTPIVHPEFSGVRISPSVYTTIEEIDRFSEAMEEIAEKEIQLDSRSLKGDSAMSSSP
jgi:isopenicillin-N epimerase